jgi:hypothetical protein
MLQLTNEMSTSEQLHFMQAHPSLMRICFMEYSINAMMDWLPCERALLLAPPLSSSSSAGFSGFDSASGQQIQQQQQHTMKKQQQQAMQTYSNIAVAMCDIFRQDAIITGQESWRSLNSMAAISIERCIRVCKFKLFKAPEPIVKGPHLNPELFDEEGIMTSSMLQPNSMDLAMSLFGDDRQRAATCLLVHSNLKVFPLPECVAIQQMEAADRMYSACSARLRAVQQMSFCSVCAINGKGFSSKLRICCITGRVSCITCPPGTVVNINMIGTLLKIGSIYYYLCPCCINLKVWTSDGMDLCPWLLSMQPTPSRCNCSSTGMWGEAGFPGALVGSMSQNGSSRGKGGKGSSRNSSMACSSSFGGGGGAGGGQCMVCHSRNVCTRYFPCHIVFLHFEFLMQEIQNAGQAWFWWMQ